MVLCPFSRPGLLVFSIDFPEGKLNDVSRKCSVIHDTGSVVVQGKVVAEPNQGKLNGSEIALPESLQNSVFPSPAQEFCLEHTSSRGWFH